MVFSNDNGLFILWRAILPTLSFGEILCSFTGNTVLTLFTMLCTGGIVFGGFDTIGLDFLATNGHPEKYLSRDGLVMCLRWQKGKKVTEG